VARHEPPVVIFGVHREVQAPLLEPAQARNASALSSHPLQSGHQYSHQQRYDSNHHQKLYQGETSSLVHDSTPMHNSEESNVQIPVYTI
jgi:hypothetical protein